MAKTTTLTCLLGASIVLLGSCAGGDDDRTRPRIIEVFACSDYCPGPEEKYLKRVYEGVDDEETCRKLGGKPYTYIGWGSYFVCIAN